MLHQICPRPATAAAIALTSFDLRPAAAAPESGPAIVSRMRRVEFGAERKRRRYRGNPAMPLAAFGAIVGTIGGIAAAQQRRDYYERHYDGAAYGYYGAGHVYHGLMRPPAISTAPPPVSRRSTISAPTAAGAARAASPAIAARLTCRGDHSDAPH